jgi:hypothetical protein
MSRRTFRFMPRADEPPPGVYYEAVAGWDRPLNRPHLTIYHHGTGGEEVVWDCLRQDESRLAGWLMIDVIHVVSGFTPAMPHDWIRAIVDDERRRTGGDTTDHTPPDFARRFIRRVT